MWQRSSWRKSVCTVFDHPSYWIGCTPFAFLVLLVNIGGMHPFHYYEGAIATALVLLLCMEWLWEKYCIIAVLLGGCFLGGIGMQGCHNLWQWWWLGSIYLTLFLGYHTTRLKQQMVTEGEAEVQQLTAHVKLWETRCHTLGQQKQQQAAAAEENYKSAEIALEEAQTRLASLRELLHIMSQENQLVKEQKAALEAQQYHTATDTTTAYVIDGQELNTQEVKQIIDELNDYRVQFHQQKLLLEQAQQREEQQQRLRQEKQRQRETLLASQKKDSISLAAIKIN